MGRRLSGLATHKVRTSQGFTLVELLVVLAIAGLMLAVAPPLITAALPGVELKAAARQTAAALRLTRETAITRGRSVAWIIDLDTKAYRIQQGPSGAEQDGPSRDGRLPGEPTIELVAAADEMRSETVGAIRFFPDGTSTGGRVLLKRDDRGYQVGVNWLTGRVSILDWRDEGAG